LQARDVRRFEAGEAFAAAVKTFQAHACCWDEAEARYLWAKALFCAVLNLSWAISALLGTQWMQPGPRTAGDGVVPAFHEVVG
jgi:hypothetical protein